ncbi:MAG: response regulator [Flavobacteriales bacterium]|nr:response regulator [Flavobacteriales bacterium]
MKHKAHILIVEDKSMLYKRMAMCLKENMYSVSEYCPSFDEALASIHKKMPDLALLDIQLKGEKTGIDLGRKLSSEYGIPFIYVTDYDDDQTFYQSLATQHEQFLVKTKPHLNTKELLRAIQTVLVKKMNNQPQRDKKSILCYTGYISELKQQSNNSVSEVPVPYSEILKITTKYNNGDRVKPNYVRIETFNGLSYYLPVSLTEISSKLPLEFSRINESEVINLGEDFLDGRINGSRLKIGKSIYRISKTYKAEVENRIDLLYQKVR